MTLSLATFQASSFTTTTTPKTVTLPTVTAGDLLVVSVLTEENSTGATINTPTSSGWTFTEIGSPLNAASNSFMRRWKATAPSTASNVVISATATSTGSAFHWGFAASLWHSSAGLKVETSTENHAQSTATDTISLALVGASSGVHLHFADWNQATSTAYTITPSSGGTRQVSTADSGRYSVVVATWTGKSGTTSFGISAPTATEKWTQFAQAVVEAQSVALPTGDLTLTGLAPSGATGGASATLPIGTLTLAGNPVTGAVTGGTSVPIPTGALALTGQPLTVKRGTTNFFYEPFTYSNGTLPSPWTTAGITMPQVVSNHLETTTTGVTGAIRVHGQDVSADWQIDFDCTAPLDTGHGGVTCLLLDSSGVGYGVFIGNAVHVQRYTGGGASSNITNVGRAGENGGGVLANHVALTYESTLKQFTVYLDGVQWAQVVDDVGIVAGPNVYVDLQNTDYPTFKSTFDELFIQNGIGSPPPTAQAPSGTLTFTGVAPTAAGSGAIQAVCPTGALTLSGNPVAAAPSGAATATSPIGALTLTGVSATAAASGSTSVAAPTGAATFTGIPLTAAPTGAAPAPIPAGDLALAGIAPSASSTGGASATLPTGNVALLGVPPTADGTGNIDVAAPIGALTLTGVAPGAAQDTQFVDVPVGILTLNGVTPTSTATGAATIASPTGALVLTGEPPTADGSGSATVATPIGALALAGVAPGFSTSAITVTLPTGILTFTDVPPTGDASGTVPVACPTGVMLLIGVAPTATGTGATTVALAAGTLTLAGLAPTGSGIGVIIVTLPIGAVLLNGVPLAVFSGRIPPFPATSSGDHLYPTSTGGHRAGVAADGEHLVASSTGGHTL